MNTNGGESGGISSSNLLFQCDKNPQGIFILYDKELFLWSSYKLTRLKFIFGNRPNWS